MTQQNNLAALNEISALITEYETLMLIIAHQYDREVWIAEHNQDPFAQIEADMVRLSGFRDGLKNAVEELGAKNLTEACDILRCSGDSEFTSVLDYILASDYEGFVKMGRLLGSSEKLAAAS